MAHYAGYPPNVGILAIEIYFPRTCVNQTELETFDNVGTGKYTIGLGQSNMAFVGDREDINSICLTAVQNLLDKYRIAPESIGRLEVGTETLLDKSKSVKTHLMQLFQSSGNTAIDGVDTMNACYGGTNALFNAVQWIESSHWDGRYALVVAGDIAVYAIGNARPTGGCGCVAMLIGPNAPLVLERGLRGTHMEHTYDFYKPKLSSEYPEVDGQNSIMCYLRALDNCYLRYKEAVFKRENVRFDFRKAEFAVFHAPFNKLVQKSVARLLYLEFREHPDAPEFAYAQSVRGIPLAESYTNRDIEKIFLERSKSLYETKVLPGTLLQRELGNLYCGSLYCGLVSLICERANELVDNRILMFSYGSGLASSMFSLRIVAPVTFLAEKLNIRARLAQRIVVSPAEFSQTLSIREKLYGQNNFKPTMPIDQLFPGTFYLVEVDEKYRRYYQRTPKLSSL